MPDRYSFSSSFGRGFGGGKPWFRVGNLDVTTTVAVVGAGVLWLLIWAIEGGHGSVGFPGPVSEWFVLISKEGSVGSVPEGQIWRLVTWPLVNDADIWTIILFAVFYMLGNQLESLMGRKPFMWFLLTLTVVPAFAVTILEVLIPNFLGFAFGLRFVELGVLVAFAAQYPTARFWPGIPAWGIAGIIVAIDFLQALGDRNDYQFTMLLFTVVTGLVGIRSFGFANEVPWIPKVPLPAAMTGQGAPARPERQGGRAARRRTRGRGNLSSVPNNARADTNAPDDHEIDALLDQVAERGLDSLSKDQRKRLEDHSRRLRKRRDE